ncbi:CAF17-like 4Fe-4S cluster assembly/insertion protein YgfZ [Acinetobacter rathckeae]|uniref:CAF17-like 4Fe-4S cluster assembly/insertion protein YgfZ n=1 Tax=Acinetobacter rathckeae TaxID=2605272 RepID=UPI0018A25250|nr:folate-binding Fe/S cluster repair protein [Acinetobacter rathckeae]MBF7686796.1 folate-binding Fe/S cluster repair protein [Acinetobacter rathckeae]MBF7695672.1 folate-binding Fe/S cluster repair protein [Acinetobacter rathckeae]
MSTLSFTQYSFIGADATKFLQGQVTIHVERLEESFTQYTVICDLKGRIQFGLWLKKISSEHFEITVSSDQATDFEQHIRKYGAFAKITLSAVGEVFPTLKQHSTVFSAEKTDIVAWQHEAITDGQAWITQATAHAFQPQELRLHQRHGIQYDKGCYLGQEVIARLWFKAQPKQWLHLIEGVGTAPEPLTKLATGIQVVNSLAVDENTYQALVIARPQSLEEEQTLSVLELPTHLQGDVARPK